MTSGARISRSRRDEILDAALQCFLVSSVAGTTIDDVRTRSGASIGSIYHHFGSKEGLSAQLYLETLKEYHDAFLAALRSNPRARAGVQNAVRHHLRWVAARSDRASYLFHCREPEVTAASDAAANDLNTRFYTEAADWLRGQVERRQIRALPPELYHALWMGPSLEYARQWLAGRRRRPDLLRAETPLAQAAWNALRAR